MREQKATLHVIILLTAVLFFLSFASGQSEAEQETEKKGVQNLPLSWTILERASFISSNKIPSAGRGKVGKKFLKLGFFHHFFHFKKLLQQLIDL